MRPPALEMESKHDPESEAVARLAGPKAGPKAAPKAVASAKTALQLMAAAVKKERAKPAAGVAKPLPAPKRKPSIFGKPKRKPSMFEPPSIDEIQVPDGLSPAMRAAYVFDVRTSARSSIINPFAAGNVRSREDFQRLNQKQQEEIERLKRKAARIRAEDAKEQAKHEAYMNEEVRKEDERKKKQKRDVA